MSKLLSVIVAAMFAASTAFIAAPAGAQMKDEPKKEMKKGEGKKKKDGKPKPKKEMKKGEGKKKEEQKK